MRALSTLTAVIALGAVATSLGSTARADDWSIGVGIGLPDIVIIAPAPAYAPPPPGYYPPGYYPPGYYPPGYYRSPVLGYGGYVDGYDHHRDWGHRHDGDDENDDN